MSFQKEIINWYNANKRDLPWRKTTDAYVIWLSEIILQQTRVEQGLPYFNRFLANFPTVTHFAKASEDEVLKLWQGLGYYSRGRNMLKTAMQIVNDFGGAFPVSYSELIKLKGIGDYTAAAISSFSNNEPRAVLDGNVFRVLSRYYGIDLPINSTEGKKVFSRLAQDLIQQELPSLYNQAMMEFGALQCKPKSPNCSICPLQIGCYALTHKKVDQLPVKLKKVKVRHRFFNYFVAQSGESLLIKKRATGDVWEQLYDFPLIETEAQPLATDEDLLQLVHVNFGKQAKIRLLTAKKHILTHQILFVQFFALDNYMINFSNNTEIKSVSINEFNLLPHPKVISDFFESHIIN
jgi:A/G-specific adenine glycosylase